MLSISFRGAAHFDLTTRCSVDIFAWLKGHRRGRESFDDRVGVQPQLVVDKENNTRKQRPNAEGVYPFVEERLV